MKYLGVLLMFGLISFLQSRPLIFTKHYKDLAVYITMMLITTTLIILQMAGIHLPSPVKEIEIIVRYLVNPKFNFSKSD